MAKRRLKRSKDRATKLVSDNTVATAESPGLIKRLTSDNIGMAGLSALLIYASYHPKDSIEVEQGNALWFCAGAFLIFGLVGFWLAKRGGTNGRTAAATFDRFDLCVFALAAWMMIAALATSSWGNLRLATNEAWLWVAGATVLYTARRVMSQTSALCNLLLLITAIGIGLSVDALYQNFVSLPQTRAAYLEDPDLILSQTGIVAPPNSALRMTFQNRLFDGGPSGTFALANSLAAFLVFCLSAAVAVLRSCWSKFCVSDRIGWGICITALAAAILATRSRSAVAASIFAIALTFGLAAVRNRSSGKSIVRWIAGLSVLATCAIVLIASFGNPEWFSAAPSSLRFRLEYWHSTWNMVASHPWFGCGPGNFQSVYDQFRSNLGSEQIADPHNFFFETLGSGGIPAILLLGSVLFFGWKSAYAGKEESDPKANSNERQASGRSVWWGAFFMFVIVWFGGLVVNNYPDVGSQRFAIPIAIAMLFWLKRTSLVMDATLISHAMVIALAGLMIHLSTAGGWTVPGIAILVWIAVGMICRLDGPENTAADPNIANETTRTPVIGYAAIALLVAITFVSIRPVAAERLSFALAESAQQNRQPRKAQELIEQAVQADDWAFRSALYKSDIDHWNVIFDSKKQGALSEERVDQWKRAVEIVRDRCGQNPSVYRQLITQALHLYQATGDDQFLDDAKDWNAIAIDWSPSNQWLFAQYAEIQQATGNDEDAKHYADEATRLSKLGNNEERAMWLQQINVVKPNLPSADRNVVTLDGYTILLDNQ